MTGQLQASDHNRSLALKKPMTPGRRCSICSFDTWSEIGIVQMFRVASPVSSQKKPGPHVLMRCPAILVSLGSAPVGRPMHYLLTVN
jgi:hypothetical protein